MRSKVKELSIFLNELSLHKEAEEAGVLLSLEEELPKRFPLAFRYWIRDVYYKNDIDARYSPKWKGITANSYFKKEPVSTKKKIYEAWKLIVDAKNDKEETETEVFLPEEKGGIQLELFAELAPNTAKNIRKLSSWLLKNKFQEEALSVLALTKLAAGRPVPIDRAEIEGIADELLAELHSKFLAYPQFSPFELYGVLARELSLDDAKIPPIISNPEGETLEQINAVKNIYERNLPRPREIEALESLVKDFKESNLELYKNLTVKHLEDQYKGSQEQYLTNYLASEVTRKKKNIRGDEISVTYRLMFSHVAERPPGVTMSAKDSSEKEIVVGFNPNNALIEVVQEYLSANEQGMDVANNRPAEIEFFKESIRPYIISVLMHEEVHAVDIINPDSKHAETYKISAPDGETLEEVAKKLEIDARSLFIANLLEIIEQGKDYGLDPMVIRAAIMEMADGNPDLMNAIFDLIKPQKLKKDFEFRVPPRSHSQLRVDRLREVGSESRFDERTRTKTLREIAEHTGLKHGIMRLIVINFNNLFAERLTRGGQPIGSAPSYQHIYDFMTLDPKTMDYLADAQLPEGSEVKLVPSYSELYSYDRGFYLLTREEGKAFLSQILDDLRNKFEKNSNLKIEETSVAELIGLSRYASDVEKLLQVNPVDKIIKTPIGYLDKLKKDRLQLFYSGMNHIREILIQELPNELTKEAVLKKKLRKTRGKGKDRMEWGLFSKSNPKKVLKWFGPKKPSKKEVAKEERRVHSFASNIE